MGNDRSGERISYGRGLSVLAERDPGRIALVHEDETVTRDALERGANRLAREFEARGVGLGDLVTIALPNSIAFVETAFAIWKLGAVPQPISSHLPEAERAALIDLAKPALVVGVDEGRYPGRPSIPAGFEASNERSDAPLPDRVSPERQALASGGSTGRPKLIIDVLPAEFDPEEGFYAVNPGQIALVPGPMYHAGPFLNGLLSILAGGAAIVMSRFDPARSLELIDRHGVQFVNFVPTMLQRIWRLPGAERERFHLTSLDRVVELETFGARDLACPNSGPETARTILRNAVRDVVSGYPVKNIYSETGRREIAGKLKTFLETELGPRGIIVQDVLLRDVKLPQRCKESIERKLTAEQKVQEKEFELDQARKEAEIEIARAKGAAKAQEIVRSTLSDSYLQYLWIKTLNENPNVIYVSTEANMPVFRTRGPE